MKIFIVDSNTDRFKGTKESFRSLYRVFYSSLNEVLECTSVDGTSSRPEFGDLKFDLCLVHHNPTDLKKSGKVKSNWRISYGGNEGDIESNGNIDPNYTTWKKITIDGKKVIPKIWRAVDAEGITTEEANELVEFFGNDIQGKVPACLLPPEPSYLSALSILCQGYLATNNKLADDIDSDNDPVNKALTKMGWNAFKNSGDYAAIVYADLLTKEKAEKTQDTNWWLSSFDKRAETAENLEQALNDKIRKAIVKEISNKVQKEWGEQDPNICHKDVCNFFIELEKETIENPDIVARAYLAISKRLEK